LYTTSGAGGREPVDDGESDGKSAGEARGMPAPAAAEPHDPGRSGGTV